MLFIRRHTALGKLFWLFMSLHILNLSVDAPDLFPESVPEDLVYNDMESIVEIVLEKILCIDDAIAEVDDDDSNQGILTNVHFVPLCFFNALSTELRLQNNALSEGLLSYVEPFTSQYAPEIVPPPPEA